MSQTTINVRIDKETKKQMEKIFSEMGMSVSTAFNIFAKAVIQRREIPFKITAKKDINESYVKHIEAALDEADWEEENGTKVYTHEEVMEKMRRCINDAKQKP